MIDKLISGVSAFIVATISVLGYGGVVLMMAIESACIPLPSEIIMPFSGYLVATGRFDLYLVAIAGAVGCLLGSYVAYFVGQYGGRPFIERYGKYVLIAEHELELADHFFDRWGSHTVFWSRMLPIVRTFIAFPAGVSRMRLLPFTIYTLLGSYLWCLALAYGGMKLGQHWKDLAPYFHRFDALIAILLIVGVAALIYNRVRGITSSSPAANCAPRDRKEPMTDKEIPNPSELEEIFTSIDPTPIRMARDYLNEAGIESFVFDAGSSRLLGTTAAVPTRLMVHRDAARDARDRLNDLGFTET
jgi:membrane protein DedA with SNARE-associated domain